jgi:sulfur carrier protein ThiS
MPMNTNLVRATLYEGGEEVEVTKTTSISVSSLAAELGVHNLQGYVVQVDGRIVDPGTILTPRDGKYKITLTPQNHTKASN